MKNILILFFLVNSCFAQSSSFKKISEGSKDYYKIDKIFYNKIEGPRTVYTKINLPDYLSITINIFNNKGDTLYSKLYENLAPGEYQFGWSYKGAIENHYYTLDILGFRNSKRTMVFYYKLPFVLYN